MCSFSCNPIQPHSNELAVGASWSPRDGGSANLEVVTKLSGGSGTNEGAVFQTPSVCARLPFSLEGVLARVLSLTPGSEGYT